MTGLIAFVVARWRYFAIVGAIVVIGWWHQHEVTRAYRQGATEREQSALKEAGDKVEADMAERRKVFAEDQARLSILEARLSGERASLETARQGIANALSASLNQIAGQGVVIRNELQNIPDSAVNGRFRQALARARQAELDALDAAPAGAGGPASKPAGQ